MKKYQMPLFAVITVRAINIMCAVYISALIGFNEWPVAILLAIIMFWVNWFVRISFKEERENFEKTQALQNKMECAHHNKHIVHSEVKGIVYLCEDCGEKIYQSNC